MRIAINTRFLLPGRLEGIGRYTYEVARRLVALRPHDSFLFIFDRPYDPHFLLDGRAKAVVAPPPARHPLLWWWWFEVCLPRVLRQEQADLLLSPDGYCSLRARVPTIMVTHDLAHLHQPEQMPGLARRYYEHFVPRYLRRAEGIVAVSAFTKQDISRQYGIPEGKITVAGNGVRPEFRPLTAAEQADVRARYTDGRPYFFYLGAVQPRKNLPRLIAAYDLFRQETGADVALLIGGRMAWQTGLVHAAWKAASHQEDIHFLGYLPDAELPRLVGGALALTYVSLFEGFGVPVLEAMHCDTPVITSNVSSLPEVAGDAALLVDPTEVREIAQAMEKLYRDELLRDSLIARGRQQRLAFNWDHTAETISELMDKIKRK